MKSLFRAICFVLLLLKSASVHASYTDSIPPNYNSCFQNLIELLRTDGSFKVAVFLTEQVFADSIIKGGDFFDYIDAITDFVKKRKLHFRLKGYNERDGENYLLNRAIASAFFDTMTVKVGKATGKAMLFSYNQDDPLGKVHWSNMFVSKLLFTHKGNCHSLSYLYKIIADELGAKCWLALAPSHIYIRNYSQKIGWYNTETTSGSFPTDAWIAASGYVSTDAIRSGIYMDTLSNQQSIALCVLDLAKCYERQTFNYYDGFILKCCDEVLKYHPTNPMALLLKAETLKKVFIKQNESNNPDAAATKDAMENTYVRLAKLHYREMPEKMYETWVMSLSKNSKKLPNKAVRQNTKNGQPARK